MNVKIDSIEDLLKSTESLPTVAVLDINKRIGDWLSSGGTLKDPYVKQQYRYAERLINKGGNNTNE